MRIVHVSDFYLPRLGGVEFHVHDLAHRQQAAGHDVTVVTATGAPPDTARSKGPAGTANLLEGVRVLRLTGDSRSVHVWRPRAMASIAREIAQLKPDVVHAHAGGLSPLSFATVRAATRLGLPTVLTMHSMLGPLAPVFGALDLVVGWADLPVMWTAVSEAAAAPLRELVTQGQVVVLPNGIEPGQWRVDPVPRAADDVVVLAVMRLAPRKRPIPLLRILEQARELTPTNTRLRAVVVGAGPMLPAMQRRVRRRGLSWVDLRGRQSREQIRELMCRADVFVAPAIMESFGIAALEARCAGIPVVADRRGGVCTFVQDGVEGMLTADDTSMAAAVASLAADPGARSAMAARSRDTPVPVSWSIVTAQVDAVYAAAARLSADEARSSRVRAGRRPSWISRGGSDDAT